MRFWRSPGGSPWISWWIVMSFSISLRRTGNGFIGLRIRWLNMRETHILVINPIIYAEVSIGFHRIEDVEMVLPPGFFRRDPFPWEAAFLAGKCFLAYRKKGGRRSSTLPDFFIGAHAAIARIPLLTRDVSRYRTYFPKLKLVAPD